MIGSNIVERCDVTLSRAIQLLVSDALRVFFFCLAYFLSVFDYTDFPCVELKDEEDLLLEKTVRGKGNVKKGPAQLIDTCNKYWVGLCRSFFLSLLETCHQVILVPFFFAQNGYCFRGIVLTVELEA